MKRLVPVLILLGMMAGCKVVTPPTPPIVTTALITWTGDGNPLVPVCVGVNLNCKSTIDIEDITTGVISSVSVTATSYTVSSSSDTYEIRTSGYDLKGGALSSAWEVIGSVSLKDGQSGLRGPGHPVFVTLLAPLKFLN